MDLHPSGALFWREQATLVVGDLHFEKASSYHRSGQFLPPYDTAETLRRLAEAVACFAPRRLILLGDVFHDGAAWDRMAQTDRDRLTVILDGVETIWVEGNHDAHFVPPGQTSHAVYRLGGITFRHIMDEAGDVPEISAHYHPAAVIMHRGARLRRACFVCTQHRLLVPAFGALAGGLDVAAEDLRKEVIVHMAENANFYMGFVLDMPWEEYMVALKSSSTWGDHLTLTALAEVLHRPIQMFSAASPHNPPLPLSL